LEQVHVVEAALKEMISFIVKDLGSNNKDHCIFGDYGSIGIEGEHGIVDSAVNKVNISNLMQLISDHVHRGGWSVS
jgi:hypothetical protein